MPSSFEPDRVHEAVVEEISTIRRMLGSNRLAAAPHRQRAHADGQHHDDPRVGPGTVIELFEQDTAPFGKAKR